MLARRFSVLLAVVVGAAGSAAQPVFESLTRADGLPSDYVQAVFQDRYGFLWFGTDAGLARYDGRHVVTYTADDGLPDPFVYSIGEDADGVLHVGTYAGVARQEGDRFVEVETPFARSSIYEVSATPTGALMVRSGFGLAIRDASGWRTIRAGRGNGWSGAVAFPDGSVVLSLTESPTGNGPWSIVQYPARAGQPYRMLRVPADVGRALWISAGDGHEMFVIGNRGVLRGRVDEDRVVAEEVVSVSSSRRVIADGKGRIYGLGERGAWVRDEPGDAVQELTSLPGQDLLVDREGGLWVGTFGHGVLRLAGRHVTRLTDGVVTRLTISSQGDVWATGDALVRVDPQSLAMSRLPSPWSGGVREVAAEGRNLFVTTGAGLHVFPDLGARAPRAVAEAPNWFSGLDATPGRLWASTYGDGILSLVDGLVVDTLTVLDGLGSNMVEGLARTSHGVWALTRSAGASLVAGETILTLGRAEGLPSSAVYALAELSDGAVWFGTDRGLGRWEGTRVATVGGDAFGRQRLLAVFERERDPGAVWVVGDRQLYRVQGERVEAKGDVHLVADPDASINQAVYHPASDRLFLATTTGLVAVDLARLPASTAAPKIVLLGVHVDDEDREIIGTPQVGRIQDVAPGSHRVEVEFAALAYRGGAGVEYSVEGEDWQPMGEGQRVVFSDLGAGTHVIEARAVGADGLVSEDVARLTFRIRPYWWERPSVVAALVLVTLVLFALAVRALTRRRLLRRVQALERERESARRLQHERERISRDLHDHVGAQLSSLLAGVELARLAGRAGGDGAPPDEGHLDGLEADARATMRQLRETIWALHDEAVSTHAFCERLRADLDARTRGLDRPRTSVRCDGDGVLEPAVALHLYRIAQEAVTNALKHAGADAIAVVVQHRGDRVELTVADNGRFAGAGDSSDLSGYGLRSMRDRAADLAGSFDLDTTDGTTIHVVVPIEASNATR